MVKTLDWFLALSLPFMGEGLKKPDKRRLERLTGGWEWGELYQFLFRVSSEQQDESNSKKKVFFHARGQFSIGLSACFGSKPGT